MALVVLSTDDVFRHIRPEEVSGYQLPDGESLEVVTERFLVEQCDKVVAFVNASGSPRIKQGVKAVPSECVSATLALTRYALLALLPGDSNATALVGSTRRAEYDEALRFLDKVADGTVSLSYEPEEGLTEEGNGVLFGKNETASEWSSI